MGEKIKRKKEYILFALLIFIFVLINLSLFSSKGHTSDIGLQQGWGNDALKNGVSNLYSEGYSDYPPLYMHVLKFNSWLTLKLYGSNAVLSGGYLFVSKLFPFLCNLVIGLALFYYLKKKEYKIALAGMILYLFNFGLIYGTSYWGQVDSVHTMLMFFSIILLFEKKYYFSSILITLACLVKLQSVVVLPVVGFIIFLNCDYKKIIKIVLANLVVLFAILIPFIFGGTLGRVFEVIFGSVGNYPYVTVNAYNFWFLISPKSPNFSEGLSDSAGFLGIQFKTIGLVMLGAYTLLVLYKLYNNRSKENIIFSAPMMALAFFILPTQIHERYLFPFFALFALIALNNRRYLWVYVTLMITHLFNLMMVMSYSGGNIIFAAFQSILDTLKNVFGFQTIAIVIALINVSAFVYLNKIWIFDKEDNKK